MNSAMKVYSEMRMSLTRTNPACVLQHRVPLLCDYRKNGFFWPGLHGIPTGIWRRCHERGSEKSNLHQVTPFDVRPHWDSFTVQDCVVCAFLSCFWSSSAPPSAPEAHPFIHFSANIWQMPPLITLVFHHGQLRVSMMVFVCRHHLLKVQGWT